MTQPAGTPPSPDQSPLPSDLVWLQAAQELAPEKTLARISDNARNVVNTVGVVGVLLSGLGFLTTTVVESNTALLIGAFASSILAAIAVALALYSLITKNDRVATGNLAEVKAWYEREIDRRRSAAIASLFLFVSAAVAVLVVGYGGYEAVDQAQNPTPDNHTRIDITSGDDGTWTVHLTGNVDDLPNDAIVHIELRNGRDVILESTAHADDDGAVSLDASAVVVGEPTIAGSIIVTSPGTKATTFAVRSN